MEDRYTVRVVGTSIDIPKVEKGLTYSEASSLATAKIEEWKLAGYGEVDGGQWKLWRGLEWREVQVWRESKAER